jgi:hypothetical protein
MKLAPRVLVAATIVGAAALSFIRAACVSITVEGPDFPVLPARVSESPEGIAELSRLDDLLDRTIRRREAKESVVAQVIAGRLTLLKAAARFRDLNADLPQVSHWLELRYPGVPYELALCRQIIDNVRDELRQHAPDQEDAIVSRLEAELAEHLDCYGEIHLRAAGSGNDASVP